VFDQPGGSPLLQVLGRAPSDGLWCIEGKRSHAISLLPCRLTGLSVNSSMESFASLSEGTFSYPRHALLDV
jgi:hypothetical protein